MNKLQELFDICNKEVCITYNGHKSNYESVKELLSFNNDILYIPQDVLQTMIDTDTIIRIQAYPDNNTGFYLVHHYDLQLGLDEMLNTIKGDRL